MGAAQAAEAPLPTGRLLTYSDIQPQLKGRQAEVGRSRAAAHISDMHTSTNWP